MKIGNINGNINNLYQVVYDSGELTSTATSITISGLTGDTDEEYELICRFVNGYSGNTDYYARLNNDSGNNYGFQQTYGTGSTTGSSQTTGSDNLLIANASTLGYKSFSKNILYVKTNGYERLINSIQTHSVTGTTNDYVISRSLVWDNTVDEVTSLVILANQTNGLGVGTRIILVRKMDVSASAIQTGNLEVQSSAKIERTWEKIYDNEISSAITTVTISGLTGNTDILYHVIYKMKNSGSNSGYSMRLNADSGANYGKQYFEGVLTTGSALRTTADTSTHIGNAIGANSLLIGESLIYAKSGYDRVLLGNEIQSITSSIITGILIYASSWNNTADEITSIVITAGTASGIGINSHIELWKLNL